MIATDIWPHACNFTTSEQGEVLLRGGYCATSGRYHFPLSDCCPFSGATDVEAVILPRIGHLVYWTVVTAPPPGYFGPVPYGLGIVTLEGLDLQLVTRLNLLMLETAAIGRRLTLEIEYIPGSPGEPDVPMWRFGSEESKT